MSSAGLMKAWRSAQASLAGVAIGATWGIGAAAHAGELTPLPTPIEVRLEPVAETAALEQAVPTPKIVRASARIQCVPYARVNSGIDLRGDAKSWWSLAAGKYDREKTPSVGSVMVMRGYAGADRGHVAVVRGVLSERAIVIDHANWLNQGEITVNVPVKDVSKKGDWSEVRVWHIPSATWGKRVYIAQGFIRPNASEPSLSVAISASAPTTGPGLGFGGPAS